ncbi:MAG TPA: enoyl-CoA hydratase-related protein, partial [Herpetosiphonaceae bacterium]|nr:enoyl-CoA hydratase-related protein [Herpetosiphonaceae bacterium]
MSYEFIRLERAGPITTLVMNRPAIHNAFNPQLIAELTAALAELAADQATRLIVLTGAGPSFSAGGDIGWMQESMNYSDEQNLADAAGLDAMFEALNGMPKPVLGRVNGAALGGGVGLVACCDLVVAVEEARFGFTEVKLGLLPAVIAQYVVPKIGVSHSRALFVAGERFSAERAYEIGLIHAITSAEELDATVASLAERILTGGPQAIAAAKRLVAAMWERERADAKQYAIQAIAAART